MLNLRIVSASTRPGRVGPVVTKWIHEFAVRQDKFQVETLDLADFNLPVFDEPEHPLKRQYQHEHTKAWSVAIDAADAFVFVTPEYDYGPPPSLMNALIYLYHEWNYKPASFVSYGGISGGLRAVQVEKLTLTSLKIMPLPEQVAIPFVTQNIAEGKFTPTELHEKSAATMLNELLKWAEALKPLRAPKS